MAVDYINQRAGAAEFYELRKIVDEGWQSKGIGLDEHEIARLGEHAARVRGMLGSLEYEITCMPVLIKNAKHMSIEERAEYIGALESIMFGLREEFGDALLVPLIYGIISKSKNLESMKRYIEATGRIFLEKQARLERSLYSNQKKIARLLAVQHGYESSLLRFFMRKRIVYLKRKIDSRLKKSATIEAKISKYHSIATKISGHSK